MALLHGLEGAGHPTHLNSWKSRAWAAVPQPPARKECSGQHGRARQPQRKEAHAPAPLMSLVCTKTCMQCQPISNSNACRLDQKESQH